MKKFVPEKENKYFAYYTLRPKKGVGILVRALNGQQALAMAGFKSIVCVHMV